MPVNFASSQTINQPVYRKNIDDTVSSGSVLRVSEVQEHAPTKVKLGVALTTLSGVVGAMVLTLKSKKIPIKSPINFLKELTKIKYDSEKPEIEKLVGRLAVGSVGGGLLGGILFDKKENRKAKYREAIIQLIGNIATPLLCVAGGIRLFHVVEPKLIKSIKLENSKLKGLPGLIVSAGCLISGIFLGNKVGNTINENMFHVKDNRKIKLSDMAPHIDDAGVGISLAASGSGSNIGHIVSRFIPLALTVAGYSVGTAQQHHCKKHDDCV